MQTTATTTTSATMVATIAMTTTVPTTVVTVSITASNSLLMECEQIQDTQAQETEQIDEGKDLKDNLEIDHPLHNTMGT